MTETKAMVYGVSLGPGDPELITLKGLKALQQADKIYYPGSIYKDGTTKSYAYSILQAYDLAADKLNAFYLEMSLNRIQAQEVYEMTSQKVLADLEKGYNVAIVSEGDLSTYSSFSYLLEKLHAQQVPVSLIPGITSFHLGASESQIPIALLNETVYVIPRIQSEQALEEAINQSETVILMKIRSVMKHILPVLEKNTATFTYYERLGTAAQFMTSEIADLKERAIPYFSLITIKKRKQS